MPKKRYNLALPEELFNELQDLADRRQTTVAELLRKFIKLGLLVSESQENRNATFSINYDDAPSREIIII